MLKTWTSPPHAHLVKNVPAPIHPAAHHSSSLQMLPHTENNSREQRGRKITKRAKLQPLMLTSQQHTGRITILRKATRPRHITLEGEKERGTSTREDKGNTGTTVTSHQSPAQPYSD
jgi:hypothetical protein